MKVRIKFKKTDKKASKLSYFKKIPNTVDLRFKEFCQSFKPKFPNIFFMNNSNEMYLELDYKLRHSLLLKIATFCDETKEVIEEECKHTLGVGYCFYKCLNDKILTDANDIDNWIISDKNPVVISKIILNFYNLSKLDRQKNDYYKQLFIENNEEVYKIVTRYHFNCFTITTPENKTKFAYMSKLGLKVIDTYILEINSKVTLLKNTQKINVKEKKTKRKILKNQYKTISFDWKNIAAISSHIVEQLETLKITISGSKKGTFKILSEYLTADDVIKDNIPRLIKLFLSQIYKISEKERIKTKDISQYESITIDEKDWVKLHINYQLLCRTLGNIIFNIKAQSTTKKMPKYDNKGIKFLLRDPKDIELLQISFDKYESIIYYIVAVFQELFKDMENTYLKKLGDRFYKLNENYHKYIMTLFGEYYIQYLRSKLTLLDKKEYQGFYQPKPVFKEDTEIFDVKKPPDIEEMELYMEEYFSKEFNTVKRSSREIKNDSILYVYYNFFETQLQDGLEKLDPWFVKILKHYVDPIITINEFEIGDLFIDLLKDKLLYIEKQQDKIKVKQNYITYINKNYYFSNFQEQLFPSFGPYMINYQDIKKLEDKHDKLSFAFYKTAKEESIFYSPKFKIISKMPPILDIVKNSEKDFCKINMLILNSFIENLLKVTEIKTIAELEIFYEQNPNFFYYFLPKDSNLEFIKSKEDNFYLLLLNIINYSAKSDKEYKRPLNIPLGGPHKKLFESTLTIKYEILRFLTLIPLLTAFFGWYPKLWSDARGRLYPEESGLNITKAPKYRNMITYINSNIYTVPFKTSIDKDINLFKSLQNIADNDLSKSFDYYYKKHLKEEKGKNESLDKQKYENKKNRYKKK